MTRLEFLNRWLTVIILGAIVGSTFSVLVSTPLPNWDELFSDLLIPDISEH